MPKRKRPKQSSRSEHWMRVAANDASAELNARIRAAFGWESGESIEWRSPIASDEYAEYYDESFLERLGISNLRVLLSEFWPASGPRWDALAVTSQGRVILVEAKAYPEEAIDYGSRAGEESLQKITESLQQAKAAFGATEAADWLRPFYQYANRLAHLYFLAGQNELDAYLVFLNFANAPDVPRPCSAEEWDGAVRVVEKCLGIPEGHRFRERVTHITMDVGELGTSSPRK